MYALGETNSVLRFSVFVCGCLCMHYVFSQGAKQVITVLLGTKRLCQENNMKTPI